MNDPKDLAEKFRTELELSNAQQTTSLPFIRHTLPDATLVKPGETFQTIVVGGSNFQKATLNKKMNGELDMLHFDDDFQPVFDTKERLFEFLAGHLNPMVSVLALNFAYPMTPTTRDGLLDGILVRGTKENTFEGLVGKAVGQEFEAYMKQKEGRELKVACANDTICLLMSGLMHHERDHLAAGIVGTGLNFAVFIDEHTAVNLEAANFDKFEQSDAGKEIDAASLTKGRGIYEKEVSGAYLYQHLNHVAQERHLDIDPLTSTKFIDTWAQDKDRRIAKAAQEVLQHSAEFTAAQIVGIMKFRERDMTFIMQGSLYWKGYQYKETVGKLVAELCPEYAATFEQVPLSDIYGGAKLVA